MIGHLIIDGVDIYNSFGVFAIEGGCKDIASFPDMKQPEIYDWAERDGIEVDLSAAAFQSCEGPHSHREEARGEVCHRAESPG